MNWQLFQDLTVANKRSDKLKGFRSNITLKFTSKDFDSSLLKKEFSSSFDDFLKRMTIDENSVDVIQSNLARRRIVFSYLASSNERVVVKWFDDKAIGCFNFIGSLDNERLLHSDIGGRVNSRLIPKYIDHGEDFIAVEMVQGDPFLKLIQDENLAPLEIAVNALIEELRIVYRGTVEGNFTVRDFNRRLHSEYSYLISTRFNIRSEVVMAAYCTPSNAQAIYYELNSRLYEIYAGISGNLPMHMTLRDLDEHNLLFDDESSTTYAVDMEDAVPGHFIFDISYLLGRLILGRDPVKIGDVILPIVDDWIVTMDPKNADSLIAMIRALTTKQLIISAMNPWLWPAESTFKRDKGKSSRQRYRWLKAVWQVIELQRQRTLV